MPENMTTSGVAAYYSGRGYPLRGWQVRRAYELGLVIEKSRMGMYRLIGRDDLPELEQALVRLGYLPSDVAAVSAGHGKLVGAAA